MDALLGAAHHSNWPACCGIPLSGAAPTDSGKGPLPVGAESRVAAVVVVVTMMMGLGVSQHPLVTLEL